MGVGSGPLAVGICGQVNLSALLAVFSICQKLLGFFIRGLSDFHQLKKKIKRYVYMVHPSESIKRYTVKRLSSPTTVPMPKYVIAILCSFFQRIFYACASQFTKMVACHTHLLHPAFYYIIHQEDMSIKIYTELLAILFSIPVTFYCRDMPEFI